MRLRAERERLKLTQQRCADAVGASLSAWKGWEKTRSMPAENLGPLAGLGFNVAYLVGVDAARTNATAGGERPNSVDTASPATVPLDLVVLGECIEALEEVKPGLSPARKAKAVAALYELVKHSPVPPQRATLLQFIRNAA